MTCSYLLYPFNLPNLEVLYILQSHPLLNYLFAKKSFIDHAFLANNVTMKRNLIVLLIKATENIDGRAEGKILSFINKNLNKSYQNSGERSEWLDAVMLNF